MLEGDPCLWGSPSIICWCGSSTNALSEKTINYKLNGNVTSDATNDLQSSYNLLNLPAQIKSGSTVKANYSYLSDGTKARALNASRVGYDYAGSTAAPLPGRRLIRWRRSIDQINNTISVTVSRTMKGPNKPLNWNYRISR